LDEVAAYFLAGAGVWLVLQLLALWGLRGLWEKAAWLSAVAMALALCVTTLGILAGSNLAPIWLALAIPVCLSWILLLWLARGLVWVVAR